MLIFIHPKNQKYGTVTTLQIILMNKYISNNKKQINENM